MPFAPTIPYHPKFSGLPEVVATEVKRQQGAVPVRDSEDLRRILAISRRVLNVADMGPANKWTTILRKREMPPFCDCYTRYGEPCICSLLAIQGHILEEASKCGGELAFAGVGSGKTFSSIFLPMVIPGIKRALLIIPPTMRVQFKADYARLARHWHVPSLAGTAHMKPGLPVLHVIAYSTLQSMKASTLLEELAPDMIIADEAHCFANSGAVRTGRFKRYFFEHPATRFIGMSGTLIKTAIANYSHMADFALRSKSPVPRMPSNVAEWDAALSPRSRVKAPFGALRKLSEAFRTPQDKAEITVEEGFARRLETAPGIVLTSGEGLDIPLIIRKRPLELPETVLKILEQVEKTWTRPDGADLLPSTRREDEMSEALTIGMVVREIQAGFFHRWAWKHQETPDQIVAWMAARKAWTKSLRERLQQPAPHMDSPKLLQDACERWENGFRLGASEYPPHTPHVYTWNNPCWVPWKALKDVVKPESEVVWISDFVAQDAAAWIKENPKEGIVWYLNPTLGAKISELSGAPVFGRGDAASEDIKAERGDRTIIASILAHGTGKNLQKFNKALVVQNPSSSSTWEQLIGREHRAFQKAAKVIFDIYQYADLARVFDKTLKEAKYVRDTSRANQRILYAKKEL